MTIDSASSARLLRLLAGPQSGAEIILQPGRYLIGTDDDCDLVLSDGQLASQHAVLVLTSDGVSIEPLEGKVVIDGSRIVAARELADFEPVVLGNTVLALGPTDAPWPVIDPPRPEGEDPETTEEVSTEDDPPPPESEAETPPEPEAASAEPAAPRASAASAGRSWARIVPRVLVALAAVLLVAGIGYRVLEWPAQQAASPEAAPTTPRDQASAILEKLDFAQDLTLNQPAEGEQLTVTGYVTTDQQRRELMAALQPVRGEVAVRVWSTQLLQGSVKQALAGLHLQLVVKSVEDGEVVLVGVLPEGTQPDALKKTLMRDVAGIRSLDLQTVSVTEAAGWLREQIQATSIPDDALKVSADGARLTVEGHLNPSERRAWQEVASGFDKRFGELLSLDDRVTLASSVATANGEASFDLVVRAINTGPPAWIKLDSNEKYLVGGRLPNGMILDSVVPNGMVLDEDGTKHLVEIAKDSGEVERVRQLETD